MVLEDLVYWLSEDGAKAPKYVGWLINYTILFVVCEFVGLVKVSLIKMQGINISKSIRLLRSLTVVP
jgi:hypothetical protein